MKPDDFVLRHSAGNEVISLANTYNVDTIVVGDLTDIRESADYGKKTNQKLHKWNFSRFISYIEYKAKLKGIDVEKISESYTSQCCSVHLSVDEIGKAHANKSNRKHRGLYICNECGAMLNADLNGSLNILKKYLHSAGKSLRRGVNDLFFVQLGRKKQKSGFGIAGASSLEQSLFQQTHKVLC